MNNTSVKVVNTEKNKTKLWVIGTVGKKQVLFQTKAIDIYGTKYRNRNSDTYEENGSLHFTPKGSNERFTCFQYVMIESSKKPAKELYDIEYGSLEWKTLYNKEEPQAEPER